MKTLKIKKRREKRWHNISPCTDFYEYVECRYYIVQMTEEEYFEYIRLKGENKNEK